MRVSGLVRLILNKRYFMHSRRRPRPWISAGAVLTAKACLVFLILEKCDFMHSRASSEAREEPRRCPERIRLLGYLYAIKS